MTISGRSTVPKAQPAAARERPIKYLFVASTGGHLAQLVRLSASMNASPDSLWVTFRTAQSLSLLEGKRVAYVPYIKSRDLKGVLHTLSLARQILKGEHFDEAISTGAALALGVLPVAKLRGVPTTYIESVSRVEGPSMTGRIMQHLHLAKLHTQHPSWADKRWQPHASVLSQFRSVERPADTVPVRPRLFVTLGTIKPYRFDAMIDAVLATGLCDETTRWQVGVTTRDDLPGEVFEQTSAESFAQFCEEADVVITHSGVGTVLSLLESGIHPVVIPRRRARGEHVDDHQAQIAGLVTGLGVASVREAPDLDAACLQRAAGLAVVGA